jgi:two-component system NtrC family response regulator
MVNKATEASAVPTPATQRVLIVEDLEDTRASLQEMLQMSPMEEMQKATEVFRSVLKSSATTSSGKGV